MEEALLEIVAALKTSTQAPDAAWLDKLVRRHSRATHDATRRVSKRRLLPYYLSVRANDPERWRSWGVDAATEQRLLALLRMKPRRTASGVATITVITKPWPCGSNCLYCPCDVRMPKSYLASEPACQRAERNFFDPYLQVKARLHALADMGHVTDKVELIVLGGTWSDYPDGYQRWFVREMFRAVNDDEAYVGGPELLSASGYVVNRADAHESGQGEVARRTAFYEVCGLTADPDMLTQDGEKDQARVNAGALSYNQVVRERMERPAWRAAEQIEHASWEEVEAEQRTNEQARRRVVGLVIETRPDLVTPGAARTLRRLGCTKVQMGIQSLDNEVLRANRRLVDDAQIARAFAVLRAFGFKTHVHFMVNLLGSTPQADKADYLCLVTDPRFLPDEVKLYPCALVESSALVEKYRRGLWRPYTEEELVDVLAQDVLASPAYLRISRMIRDISATDILVGNKKTNLRQMVEAALEPRRAEVREIRMREVSTSDVALEELRMDVLRYQTAGSAEAFLQWVDEQGHIAGFCRLSLPDGARVREAFAQDELPLAADVAIIREVHVYGRVTGLGKSQEGAAQHAGLGKALVEKACSLAFEAGFARVAVISAVGTREYYRKLDFCDEGLYQVRVL